MLGPDIAGTLALMICDPASDDIGVADIWETVPEACEDTPMTCRELGSYTIKVEASTPWVVEAAFVSDNHFLTAVCNDRRRFSDR